MKWKHSFAIRGQTLVQGLARLKSQAELIQTGSRQQLQGLGAWLKQKARFLPQSKLHQETQQPAIRWLKSGWGLALRRSWKWAPVVATQPTGRRVAVFRTTDSCKCYSASKVWPQVVFWSLVPGAPGNVQCEVCQNITMHNQVRPRPSA